MKLKSITIVGIGGIRDLSLQFHDQINFISGPNGIGKTTILECVAHTFSVHGTNIIKRNVGVDNGSIRSTVDVDGVAKETVIEVGEFAPEKKSQVQGMYSHAKYLFSLKVTRTFQYQKLTAVSKDTDKTDNNHYQETKSGININEVKNWFVNRYLYSAHKGALSNTQLENFELAKDCFSYLNPDFGFSKVLASSNEIMVKTPSGEIYYEYLSSGFKSCLSLLFGIIKDIEFRFKEPGINAKDFDGIVLIDELELHLHPEWQSKISKILVQVFPKVQFITATHSPHIIQNANPGEIIALVDDAGHVTRRSLPSGDYGFQGWSIEEVLTEVMGMKDTRTKTYHNALSDFEKAIQAEDYTKANEVFNTLDALLHPENSLRKILRLELASIKVADS
jgi:predicted ATP-binding protein involved in virulence